MMYTLNIVLFCQLYLNKAETNKQTDLLDHVKCVAIWI